MYIFCIWIGSCPTLMYLSCSQLNRLVTHSLWSEMMRNLEMMSCVGLRGGMIRVGVMLLAE